MLPANKVAVIYAADTAVAKTFAREGAAVFLAGHRWRKWKPWRR